MNNATNELREMINHTESIPALRLIWNRLVMARGGDLGTAKAIAREYMEPDAPALHNAVEVTIREFDRARERLTVSTFTGRREWVVSHFGEYRNEKIYSHDESAFDAACAAILAEVRS